MEKHQHLLQDAIFSFLALCVVTIGGLFVMGYEIHPVFREPVAPPPQNDHAHVAAHLATGSSGRRASLRENHPAPASRHMGDASTVKTTEPPRQDLSPAERAVRDEKLKAAMGMVDEGNWQDAEKALQELLARYPDFDAALSEMAMIYYIDKRDPAGAIPYMERSVKANPSNVSMINEMIAAYQETGRPDEALQSLQRLSQEGQDSPALESGMARLLRDQGRYDDSVQHLQKGLASAKEGEPTSGILEELGDTYQFMGDTDKAIESYDKVLAEARSRQGSPNDPIALDNEFMIRLKLAQAKAKLGDTEEAQRMLGELERDSPGDTRLTALRQELGQSTRF